MKQVSETRCFGGRQLRFEHDSEVLNCTMQFSVFLPLRAEKTEVPAVYFLSGLTCTDENFSTKAGAQRVATELGTPGSYPAVWGHGIVSLGHPPRSVSPRNR